MPRYSIDLSAEAAAGMAYVLAEFNKNRAPEDQFTADKFLAHTLEQGICREWQGVQNGAAVADIQAQLGKASARQIAAARTALGL